jgi:pimeloyl-ACP methyl ester carboxylesterase
LQAVVALQTDWESHMGRIIAPTIVVWGAHDAITPLALGRDIVESVADAQLLVLPNAGHNPMCERAEAFNTEVLRFLTPGDDTGK